MRPKYYLVGLLVVFAALGAVYAVVTPLFEMSDELWHYPMVKRLADGLGLPVQDPANVGPWRQEGSQPPLYYAVMALATSWIDTRDMGQVRWLNPHADNGIITLDGNNNIAIHTARENWPWQGTVLAVRLIRLLSVLLGAGVVYFTYRLALEVAPGKPALALAAAAFAGFTPMFIFISASVNNDTLAIFFSTAALWLMAKWLRAADQSAGAPPAKELALMGAVLGGAALSKESALGLFALAGAALAYVHFRARRNDLWQAIRQPSAFLTGCLVVFGIALAICGWWYWRNFQLYNDWLGWNAFVAVVGKRANPATLAQLWGERVGFMQAYWGLFGGVSVPLPGWVYTTLNVLTAVGLAGAALGAVRAVARRKVTWTQLAQWSLLAGWVIVMIVALIRWTSVTWASQGRLIFPAISAVSVIVVFGLDVAGQGLRALVAPASTILLAGMTGFMALLAAVVPFTTIAPAYAPPPELTPVQINAIPHRADADFGGEMKLLGYAVDSTSVLPGEAVTLTLYWQSEAAMDRNWSIFLHLVDDQNVIVAQRDRYPGMGALATTLLHPGQTFADRYVLPLPAAAYAPAGAALEVGLYDLLDGARASLLSVQNPSAVLHVRPDALALAAVDIGARPGAIPNALDQNFGQQIDLAGYSMDRRQLSPGQTFTLTLYWQALGPIDRNYSVFTHVRGQGDTLWAGKDSWPQNGAAPTSTWRVGQVITDTYQLTLKPDTPAGQYDVEVGLYDGATMQRLQAFAADGRPTDADYVDLSKINVTLP